MTDNKGDETTSTGNLGILSRYEKCFIVVGDE